jgi:hypothetical protein
MHTDVVKQAFFDARAHVKAVGIEHRDRLDRAGMTQILSPKGRSTPVATERLSVDLQRG